MTDTDRREAARQFCQRWVSKGREDEDARSYWIEFLQNIIGMDNVTERVEFEKKVIGPDGNTKRIDVYIPETRVLIEQKSLSIDLAKPQQGHDGMTPYEQAKMYDNSLPVSEKAKWIVVSNFAEIWVYDMDSKRPEPVKYQLSDIQTKYSQFDFMVHKEQQKLTQEMEVSFKAGEFVGLLYDAFLKQYLHPEKEETLRSLNILCVRLVFCLYAEDAHIFDTNNTHIFHDYMESFKTKDMRRGLIDLFNVLDQDPDKGERDPYLDDSLAQFPYVNGGLFSQKDIEIPHFTEEIRDVLLNKASEGFDWSQISPTIFGAVFESTLNQETRRSGGMHYTSIENIHKVIDPLFLDGLKAEYEEISTIQVERVKKPKLEAFQTKISGLKWLDPSCGSGNFLTETYISIRRLENSVIRAILDCDHKQVNGQIVLGGTGAMNPIKVSISQFYGIELNDFAVTVAKTALWIAESQMMKETEDIIHMSLNFLPLKTNAHIVEGNALRIPWETIISRKELNYIMGNPPFVGYSLQTNSQKDDILSVYIDEKGKPYKSAGKIDYVSGWYFKAAELIQGTDIKAALVSTNSITQGEQVSSVWKPLYERFDININFAYRTFRWDSESNSTAHVHCVIVGFSNISNVKKPELYNEEKKKSVENINPYLIDAPTVFIQNQKAPICDVPQMITGNRPADGGHLIIEANDYETFISQEPNSRKYIKKLIGSDEFINNRSRYCLWLVGVSPNELRSMPGVMKRVNSCREDRLNSPDPGRRKLADCPTLFRETNNPDAYIVVPAVSSERRRYIPMGFLDNSTIATNAVMIIPDATKYHFGILESNVHMAWMRLVAGRLEMRYRYSKEIVYNNFPWPDSSDEQKANIEQTAQAILDARALYPESSLADLYDPLTMPPELQKAHTANDRAVMQAYGFSVKDMSEADCVAALMKMYQDIINSEKSSAKK